MRKKKITVKKLCEDWMMDNEGASIKLSTRSRYESMITKQIVPLFGEMRLVDVSGSAQSMVDELLNTGRVDRTSGLSAGTVQLIVTLFRQLLAYGNEKYDMRVTFKAKILQREPSNMRILTKNEQHKLLRHIEKNQDDGYAMAMLIAMTTGLRVGEIAALKSDDIDFRRGIITVSRTCQRIWYNGRSKVYIETPKTYCSYRDVPLPAITAQYIKSYCTEPELFLLSKSSKPFEPRLLQTYYNKVLTQMNIYGTTFHTLRHTFATSCIESGIDPKTVSEMLGHANVAITLHRYTHTSLQHKKDAMRKVSGKFWM